jgi:hypothetical protein
VAASISPSATAGGACGIENTMNQQITSVMACSRAHAIAMMADTPISCHAGIDAIRHFQFPQSTDLHGRVKSQLC